MEVETSTKTFAKRPRIKPGFYAARLAAVKTTDKEGKLFEKFNPKFASTSNFAILEFDIFKKNEDDVVTGPATFTEKNNTSDVTLSQFINWRYTKKSPTGESIVTSGFSPNSGATQTYKALGWGGPEEGKKIDMDAYLGKWAEVIVDDFKKVEDGGEVIFSVIKEVKPFAGTVPTEYGNHTAKPVEERVLAPDEIDKFLEKQKVAKMQLEAGDLTQKGYEKLIDALKKEHGVD